MIIERCLIITNDKSMVDPYIGKDSFCYNTIWSEKALPRWLMWLVRWYAK